MPMLSPILLAPKTTNVAMMEGGLRKSLSKGWGSINVYHGEGGFDEDRGTRQFPNYSQCNQDKIMLALTAKLDDGALSKTPHFFIDLAANDAKLLSNTLRLEENGWEGICIEPNPIYWYHLAHRSCSVVAAFVGGVEDKIQVNVSLSNGAYGGIVGPGMDNRKPGGKNEKRFTVSLPTVLQKFQVPNVIDYLSLDVEGAELLVMKDFPFENYQFKFMTVERPKPELRTLFAAKGYLYVMNLSGWGETLWVHNTIAITSDEIKEIVTQVNGVKKV
jgi:FkbM family methyltransferase